MKPLLTINIYDRNVKKDWQRLIQAAHMNNNEKFLQHVLAAFETISREQAANVNNHEVSSPSGLNEKWVIKLNVEKSQQTIFVNYGGAASKNSTKSGKLDEATRRVKMSGTVKKCEQNSCHRCSICNVTCLSERSLTKHMKLHIHTAHSKTFQCSTCCKSFTSNSTLKTHRVSCLAGAFMHRMRGAGVKNSKALTNNRGGKVLTSSSSLQCINSSNLEQTLLVDDDRVNVDSYQCDTCGRKYKTIQGLTAHHKKEHVGIRYQCRLCGALYTTRHTLHVHITQQHYPSEVFPCRVPGCDRVYHHSSRLRDHTYRRHPQPQHTTCDKCRPPVTFRSRDALYKHSVKFHRGVRYPCPVCGRGFGARAQVPRHLAAIHGLPPPGPAAH